MKGEHWDAFIKPQLSKHTSAERRTLHSHLRDLSDLARSLALAWVAGWSDMSATAELVELKGWGRSGSPTLRKQLKAWPEHVRRIAPKESNVMWFLQYGVFGPAVAAAWAKRTKGTLSPAARKAQSTLVRLAKQAGQRALIAADESGHLSAIGRPGGHDDAHEIGLEYWRGSEFVTPIWAAYRVLPLAVRRELPKRSLEERLSTVFVAPFARFDD